MEIDDREPTTYEERMLDFAERQTRATEALRNYAFVALLLAAVGAIVWIVWALN